jgi:hypothetical protein
MSTLTNLAKDVAAYYQELRGRDMPAELAEQLTRDYQQARTRALYGEPQITIPDPATLASAVRDELIGVGRRDQSLSGGVLGGY